MKYGIWRRRGGSCLARRSSSACTLTRSSEGYLSIYLCIYIYVYIGIYLSFYKYIYLSIYLSIYIYIYIYVCIYTYVCIYIYIYIYITFSKEMSASSPTFSHVPRSLEALSPSDVGSASWFTVSSLGSSFRIWGLGFRF